MNNLLFFGDLASPDEYCSKQLLQSMKANANIFTQTALIGNLEGLLANESTDTPTPILFNHPSVVEALKFANTKALSLSNNHTLDLANQFDETIFTLSKHDITCCGAGKSLEDAEKSGSFEINKQHFLVYGYSWEIMFHNQKNPKDGLHVAKTVEKKLIKRVKEARENNPDTKIILLFHWNFDLETLPFPMDRELSKALINAGANIVIGSHSHCVQGVERYKHGVIAYGLGNFFIPWHTFINGKIEFPEFSRLTLALEWNYNNNQLTCHWFKYQNDNNEHKLILVASEDFENSERIRQYTPYAGMSQKDYEVYFTKNRRKGFLLPVYKNHSDKTRNNLINFYLKKRIWFARLLAKLKLREWNN